MSYKIQRFQVLDSTNDYVLSKAAKGEMEKDSLVVAERQPKGRGRGDHSWEDLSSSNIYMSLYIEPELDLSLVPNLTLINAIAVHKAINNLAGPLDELKIKWPNDILLKGKKITGILTESLYREKRLGVVIGTGINVSGKAHSSLPNAGSINSLLNTNIEKEEIIQEYLKCFEKLYNKYREEKSFSGFTDYYNSCLINTGKKVVYDIDGNKGEGKALGIDEKGCLLVNTDKEIMKISSGEVFTEGIY